MNGKFSTLLAGILLASAFSANAADAWKQVKASELVTGGEYVITNAAGDSVLVPVACNKTTKLTVGAGWLQLRSSNKADSTWVVTKSATGFTLKNTSVNGDKKDSLLVAKSNVLQFSTKGSAFVLNEDSSLQVSGSKTYIFGLGKGQLSTNSATPSKFVFWAQEKAAVTTDSIAAGSKKVADLKDANAVFVMDQDGNYVGVSEKTALRAVDTKLQAISAEDFLALTDKSRFVWLNTEKGLKSANAKADLYLTADATTGVWTTNAKAGATVENGYLVVNGENASQISLFTSTVPTTLLPVDGLTALTSVADGSYYILMANGQVVNEDSELADYEESGWKVQVWQAEVAKEGDGSYVLRFVNKNTGKYLQSTNTGSEQYYQVEVTKVAGKNEYTLPADGFQLMTATSNEYATSDFSAGAVDQALTFGVAAVQDRLVTLDELKDVYGASFGVTVKRATGEKALVNNPFTGKLAPVTFVKVQGNYYLNAPAGTYMLQKENGNLIAVSPAKYANRTDATYGYKVVEISPKDLYLALNATTPVDYAYGFQLYAPGSTFVGEDAAASYILAKDNNEATYRLGALTVDGVGIALSAEQGEVNNYTDALQIKLGTFTKIDLAKLLAKPSFYQVTVVNKTKHDNYGKVLGLNSSSNGGFVTASEVLVGYPETQWAIHTDAEGSTMQFVNREQNGVTGLTLDPSEVYTTDVENVFSIANPNYPYGRDTIEIKPIATAETDGYLHLATSEWKNNLYYVGVNSSVWKGLAYVTENHKDDHKLGLDTDKDNATAWKLTAPWIYEKNALGEVVDNCQETFDIAHTLWYWSASKGEFVNTDKDGKETVYLTIPVYSFMNSANSEYMGYNGSAMIVGEYWDDDYYALKETAEGKYNLVRYTRKYENKDGYYVPTVLEAVNYKIYGGDSADKGILNLTGMYDQTENDIFSIEVAEAPEYVKLNYGDKIKIYRDEQESNVLYEKGEFAGIGNAVEFANINPALYVDTAWMNRDEVVNRYDYLLAVNAKQATKAYECNVPDHKHLYHYTDTTYGRFLVNLVDSAIVEAERDIHTNKYLYDDRYAKLGFVEAKHTGDKLIIASSKDTIEVGTPAYNLVKFAFRTVDPEAGTFVIETGYKNPSKSAELYETPGYLRWINGNLVVTSYRGDAEVFSLKATENEATANEAIAAEGVQVIAGKGTVTVQGAAGKVITVANILGQTIANQVAASDNVTIAAPAGVVVVAVDGEATKVVVK